MYGGGQKFSAGQAVVDRGIAVTMSLGGNAGFVFLAPKPATAVDMNEQRSGFLGLDLPEIELHVLVCPIGNVLVSRLDLLGAERRK